MAVADNAVSDAGAAPAAVADGPPAAADRLGGDGGDNAAAGGAGGFDRGMRELEELLSKLNPMAEEFVPPSLAATHMAAGDGSFLHPNFVLPGGGMNYNAAGFNRRVWLIRDLALAFFFLFFGVVI